MQRATALRKNRTPITQRLSIEKDRTRKKNKMMTGILQAVKKAANNMRSITSQQRHRQLQHDDQTCSTLGFVTNSTKRLTKAGLVQGCGLTSGTVIAAGGESGQIGTDTGSCKV